MAKQLYRSSHNSVISGVCGGLGEYFNIDPVIVRIIWLLLFFSGVGILAYFIAWMIIPLRSYDEYEVIEDYDERENGGE